MNEIELEIPLQSVFLSPWFCYFYTDLDSVSYKWTSTSFQIQLYGQSAHSLPLFMLLETQL